MDALRVKLGGDQELLAYVPGSGNWVQKGDMDHDIRFRGWSGEQQVSVNVMPQPGRLRAVVVLSACGDESQVVQKECTWGTAEQVINEILEDLTGGE